VFRLSVKSFLEKIGVNEKNQPVVLNKNGSLIRNSIKNPKITLKVITGERIEVVGRKTWITLNKKKKKNQYLFKGLKQNTVVLLSSC
jgi:hypothetical protein